MNQKRVNGTDSGVVLIIDGIVASLNVVVDILSLIFFSVLASPTLNWLDNNSPIKRNLRLPKWSISSVSPIPSNSLSSN